MTKEQVNSSSKVVTTGDRDTERTVDAEFKQGPFQVVLVDIKKAAHDKIIRCVKRPLLEEVNLKYVAISYRWGETHETTVDTQAGYLASITSFELQDFFGVCKALTMDPDTSSIEYVWVDAICVNQTNYRQRKATIQHMTDIYERATCILAVPDLHASYLWGNKLYTDPMTFISGNRNYIYHLLHGNNDPLDKLDALFLDSIDTPNDPSLRRLLTRYTDCFAVNFLELQEHYPCFHPMDILNHLYDNIYPRSSTFDLSQLAILDEQEVSKTMDFFLDMFLPHEGLVENEVRSLHQCHYAKRCPLKRIPLIPHKILREMYSYPYGQSRGSPQQRIYQRGQAIRRSVHFLTELVKDWSTRVWVISEFHIAKRKRNLKFWFTQLMPEPQDNPTTAITFYNLDFNDPKFDAILKIPHRAKNNTIMVPDVVYLTFYKTFIEQLNRRTFLEMMLQSKATKNEDRFYAIFPQFLEYKRLLTNHENEDLVKSWGITSILSVKLKLYEVMTTNDKLRLLYLSGQGEATHTLPTFATSSILWNKSSTGTSEIEQLEIIIRLFDNVAWNDGDHVRISLFKTASYNDGGLDHGLPLYYLNLKIDVYKVASKSNLTEDPTDVHSWDYFVPPHLKETLYSRLHFNDDGIPIDVVAISTYPQDIATLFYLFGSFRRNIWVLGNSAIADISNINWELKWKDRNSNDDWGSFNIY